MKISKEDVLEYITGLSVFEISELINEFEKKFGVKANPEISGNKKTNTPKYVELNNEYNKLSCRT